MDTPIVRAMHLGGKVKGVAKGRGKAPGRISIEELSAAVDSDEEAVEAQRSGVITLVKAAIKVGRGVAGKPWSIDATNNLAEYAGLIKALEWILENEKDHEIEILGDSELVIKQLNREYKVEAPHLVALHRQCMNLLRRLDWKARSIPREENEIADAQSKRAYEDYSAGSSSER